jgi:hypothetical protein
VFLFILGISLAVRPGDYFPSSCWGHLGCNYYERIFSPVNWLGLVSVLLGVAIFYKTVKLSEALKKSRWIIISLMLVLFLTWHYIYSPPMVFTDAGGKPYCTHCIIHGYPSFNNAVH